MSIPPGGNKTDVTCFFFVVVGGGGGDGGVCTIRLKVIPKHKLFIVAG